VKLDDLDLHKLRTFAGVAEAGSVSAAARRLGVTRSAVSQSLAGLEAQLGLPLFHRVGRRLVLTREGERLRRSWAEVGPRLQEALDALAGEEREARGPVRIGLFVGFPSARLAPLLADFAAAHPAAHVRLRFAGADDLAQALLRGRLDFVLALDPWRDDRRVRSHRLFEQELVLVAGGAFRRRTLDPQALREIPVVDYYRSDPLVARWLRHHWGMRAPRLAVAIWAASTDLVLELVLRGVGVGVLPRHVAQPHVARGRLRLAPTQRPELRELRSPRRSLALDAFRAAAHRAFA
jgi:DNA-binding transcriptional LysR family regulator